MHRRMVWAATLAALLTSVPLTARQAWLADVRAVVLGALSFPAAAGLGRAADGNTVTEWVVNPPEGGAPGAPIEVVRNRLNPINQQKAAVHDEEATALQDSLRVEIRQADPRGLEQIDMLEARWQADSRLRVTFEIAQAAPYVVDSAASPFVTPVPGVEAVIAAVRGNVYGYEATAGARRQQKWREAEARVFVGPVTAPTVARRPGFDIYDVSIASDAPVLVVHLAGNEDLITQVIDTTDWARVAALAR
ncbi:MAG: hypothetical protein AB7G21_14090 [Dehalococcoidia bacterium]